eukprot:4215862-Prorocentrum_lima.AAC.1
MQTWSQSVAMSGIWPGKWASFTPSLFTAGRARRARQSWRSKSRNEQQLKKPPAARLGEKIAL